MKLRPRRRRTLGASALVGIVLTVSACSSSSSPQLGAAPKVTGAGKHYRYQAAHVAKSKWPDPCSLLTRSSAEAGIGTTVTVKRFHTNCYYQPGSADYPRLTITLLAVGTGSDSSFRTTSKNTVGANRSSIPNVGRSAYFQKVRTLPAYRINVLTRYAHFAVTEQSPVGQRLDPAKAQALLTVVGRVVAKAFAG